jgi:hypothetical protein
VRQLRLATIVIPALLLAGCGGGSAPPAQTSSAAPAAAQTSQAAVVAPAADDALKPLFGSWGLDPANCGDQVLKISKVRFEGPGSGCDISGYTDNGDGTYTAAMTCTANGATASERIQMRPIFGPTGEGIDIVYLDRKSQTSEVIRCAAAN